MGPPPHAAPSSVTVSAGGWPRMKAKEYHSPVLFPEVGEQLRSTPPTVPGNERVSPLSKGSRRLPAQTKISLSEKKYICVRRAPHERNLQPLRKEVIIPHTLRGAFVSLCGPSKNARFTK